MLISLVFSRLRAWLRRWDDIRELEKLNSQGLSDIGFGRSEMPRTPRGGAWEAVNRVVLESR